MKEQEKEQSTDKPKSFPILEVFVFSVYGLLIYLLYYLFRYGI